MLQCDKRKRGKFEKVMDEIKTILPGSPLMQDKKLKAKSEMFIRIGSRHGRNDAIYFSRSAAKEFGIVQFDKVALHHTDEELWLKKHNEGYIVSVDKTGNTRICDVALTKWFMERFRKKPPFRLTVTKAIDCLYIKK